MAIKHKPPRRARMAAPGVVPNEMVEQGEVDRIRDELSQLREEYSLAQRVTEDFGWASLSSQANLNTNVNRHDAIRRSRFHALYNPLLKRAISLTIDFTFGQGVGWTCNDPELRDIIDSFWRNPHNQKVITGYLAQKEQFKNLYVDGGIWFVLFTNPQTGAVIVRSIPYEEIDTVVSHPDDSTMPLLYKRTRTKQVFDFKNNAYKDTQETLWYRDYQATEDALKAVDGLPDDLVKDGVIYHLAINRNGKFGLPEAFSAIDWGKAFRDFIQDRATINKAATQISMKKKVKGGAGAIEAERQRLSGRLDSLGVWPITPNTGSVLIENEGVSTEWFKTDTGASSAHEDARMLLLPFCAGTGIYAHYLGDGGDANLATATSMNAPMMRAFQSWQTLWETVFQDLFNFQLREKARRDLIEGANLTVNEDSGLEEIEWEPRPLYDANGQPVPDRQKAARAISPMTPVPSPPTAISESAGAAAGVPPTADNTAKGPDLSGDERPGETSVDGIPMTTNPRVSVEFPPVVARETAQILQALGQIYAMALPHVPSAQKVIARFFLGEMGITDVEQEVGIWFAEQEAAQQIAAQMQQQAMAHEANLAVIRGTAGKFDPATGRPIGPTGAAVGDASGDSKPQNTLGKKVRVIEPPSATKTPT